MEKIKAFFAKKSVKTVCIVVCCLSVAGLILGGLTTEAINGLVVAVAVIIAAVSALLAYIGKL